jgi:hypothetical protein
MPAKMLPQHFGRCLSISLLIEMLADRLLLGQL